MPPHGCANSSRPGTSRQGTWMNEALRTCDLPTSPDTCNVTFSPASADGPTPLILPDGRVIDPCGLALALASLSARQVKALGLRTSGIYGPPGSISSRSASLQSSLESRLKARLGRAGLIESQVTWKASVTPSGLRYCKRVASTHPISVTGSGSLPTPSGTSNHGKNHVAGRMDEWGGSSNPFRGTSLGKWHVPGFELWMMGYPAAWLPPTLRVTLSSRKSLRSS